MSSPVIGELWFFQTRQAESLIGHTRGFSKDPVLTLEPSQGP